MRMDTTRDTTRDCRRGIGAAMFLLVLLRLSSDAFAQPEVAPPELVAEAQRLNDAAGELSSSGDVNEAIEVSRQAVEINRKVHGEQGRKTALAKSHLALSVSRNGDHKQSLTLWSEALEVARKELGEQHESTQTLLENVAGAHRELGQPAEAAARFQKLLAIYRRSGRESTSTAASAYVQLGIQQHTLGDYSAARRSLERSIAIYRQVSRKKDVEELIKPILRLGVLFREQGDSALALTSFHEGLRLALRFYGEKHADTADAYNNIAVVQIERGDFTGAAGSLLKALQIRIDVLGIEHPDTAFTFENTAAMFVMQRRYGDAEKLLDTALGIRRKHRDSSPYLLSNVLTNLAVIHHRQGKHPQAVEATREAISITGESIGDHHPLTFVQWENLAMLQMLAGDFDGACESTDHVRRAIRRHVAKVLPGLSDQEQVQFLTSRYRRQLHQALSMAYQQPDHEGLRSACAGWLLNGKAVTQNRWRIANSLSDSRPMRNPRRPSSDFSTFASAWPRRRWALPERKPGIPPMKPWNRCGRRKPILRERSPRFFTVPNRSANGSISRRSGRPSRTTAF